MKLKILEILICTLFLVAAFEVTANRLYIEKSNGSIAGSVQDEYLDIAITNAFSNELEIYLGNGAGGFTNHGDFSVDEFPAGITDGEFEFVSCTPYPRRSLQYISRSSGTSAKLFTDAIKLSYVLINTSGD